MTRTTRAADDRLSSPLVYFVHLPKTAGISLKAFLENGFSHGEALVIDEWMARALPVDEIRRFRLLSGHYSSEVLHALDAPPDFTAMLVREPVARLRSWLAHCRRLRHGRYRDMSEGKSDREVIEGPQGYTCWQAHWLARAVRAGADYAGLPDVEEIPELLDQVDAPGLTEEVDRYMQLVAFRLGWPPPPSWHINRRPKNDQAPLHASDVSDAEAAELLAVDLALYAEVATRFWMAYAAMLSSINPHGREIAVAEARQCPVSVAQEWLRVHYERTVARLGRPAADRFELGADRPVAGEGWWWRECPQGLCYRWTGPSDTATVFLPPLAGGRCHTLEIEIMGAADLDTWERCAVSINDRPVDVVRERRVDAAPGAVTLRLHATIGLDVVAAQAGATRVDVHAPAKQSLTHVQIEESFDTYNPDSRAVGLAIHAVHIRGAVERALTSDGTALSRVA